MTDIDLTPRDRALRKKRSLGPMVLVLVIVVAIGALLFKTLGDASLFFKNADEAVEQRDDLGSQRFRMLGSVVPGTITKGDVDGRGAVLFTVSFDGVVADVASFDNPTELFKDGIPVVLEGHWRDASKAAVSARDCTGSTGAAFATNRSASPPRPSATQMCRRHSSTSTRPAPAPTCAATHARCRWRWRSCARWSSRARGC